MITRTHRLLVALVLSVWPVAAFAQPQTLDIGTSAEASVSAEDEEEGYGDSSFDPGGQVGFSPVAGQNHYLVNLTVDAHLSAFQSAIRAPLRFAVNSGDIRGEDYDEAGDFLRIGQCVRLDFEAPSTGGSGIDRDSLFEKERGQCLPWQVRPDDYYLSIRLAKIDDYTLGHGTVLQDFSNSTDVDHYNAGIVADMQLHEFFAGQAVVDRLLGRDNRFGPSVIGGHLALRPYTRYSDEGTWAETVDQFEVAITSTSDLHAPTDVDVDDDGVLEADGQGNIVDDDIDFGKLAIIGLDAVYRFRWAGALQVETRLDLNKILGFGQGGHGQFWFIFHERRFTVRAEAEYRFVSPDYVPGYFDSAYGITSQQFNFDAATTDAILTKFEYLESLDPDGAYQHGVRGGFHFDYQVGEGANRRSVFVLRGGLDTVFGREIVEGQGATNLDISMGIPRLANKIDIMGQYSSRNAASMEDLFSIDNTVTRLFVRWDLSSQFYLNLNFNRIWRFAEDEGFRPSTDAIASIGFQETLASARVATEPAAE